MRKWLLLPLLLMMVIVWPAQARDDTRYSTEDGVVSFTVPADWTVEEEVSTPGEHYTLFLYKGLYNPFLGGGRSSIAIDVIREGATETDIPVPQDASNLQAYAAQLLGLRAALSMREIDLENGQPALEVDMDTPDGPWTLYFTSPEPGWVVVASLAAEEREEQNIDIAALLTMTESLTLDTTPKTRRYAPYPQELLDLEQTYTYADEPDNGLVFGYPDGWRVIDDGALSDGAGVFVYEVAISDGDTTLAVQLLFPSSEAANLPQDRNTPQEIVRFLREDEDADTYQISGREIEIDADGGSLTVGTAIDEAWYANVRYDGRSTEAIEQVAVSVLMSMRPPVPFTGQQMLGVGNNLMTPLPVGFNVASTQSNETGGYVLLTTGEGDFLMTRSGTPEMLERNLFIDPLLMSILELYAPPGAELQEIASGELDGVGVIVMGYDDSEETRAIAQAMLDNMEPIE